MSKKNGFFGFAMGILMGVVGGAIAGILTAPKSGEETREELKEAIDKFSEKISPEIDEAKRQALDLIENSKCKLEKQYEKFNENIKAQKMAKAKDMENNLDNY